MLYPCKLYDTQMNWKYDQGHIFIFYISFIVILIDLIKKNSSSYQEDFSISDT